MLFVYISAAFGLIGFLLCFLSGVTVIGVCKYKRKYIGYFESLRRLGTLATIKKMARSYLGILNKFLGPNVGFKQKGVVNKTKFFGIYIEHLLLFYWFSATILVLAFRPVEQSSPNTSSLLQAGAFLILLTTNVLSDAVSLLWTKRCIALLVIPRTRLSATRLLWILFQDLAVAFLLMIAVQIISNGLYAVQIGAPERFLIYMFDPATAFKAYTVVDPRFSYIRIPGQLFITCTTYLPSALFYIFCLFVLALIPFHRLIMFALNVFRLDTGPKCNQPAYIGSLLTIVAIGFSSLSYSLSQLMVAFSY